MTAELIDLRVSTLSIAEGIAELTHRNPAARNALTEALCQDYAQMLDQLQSRPDVRVLLLTGADGYFCSGGDLKMLKHRADAGDAAHCAPNETRRLLQSLHRWAQRLRDLEIPVIAAVDGPAYGAGLSLALTADFVLASTRASFCMSFMKIGLIPDAGSAYLLPRMIGLQKAKELMYSARRVDAQEAQQLGIVHSVFETEHLMQEARAFARRFLHAPREALGMLKTLLNRSFETPYATLTEMEGYAQGVARDTPYHRAAIEAFLRHEAIAYDWDRLP